MAKTVTTTGPSEGETYQIVVQGRDALLNSLRPSLSRRARTVLDEQAEAQLAASTRCGCCGWSVTWHADLGRFSYHKLRDGYAPGRRVWRCPNTQTSGEPAGIGVQFSPLFPGTAPQVIAALRVQVAYCRHLARREFWSSAVQRAYRCHRARVERTRRAAALQRRAVAWRAAEAELAEAHINASRERAAIMFGAAFRGWHCRRRLKRLRSITRVQCIARGHMTRFRLRARRHACLLQRSIRCRQARRRLAFLRGRARLEARLQRMGRHERVSEEARNLRCYLPLRQWQVGGAAVPVPERAECSHSNADQAAPLSASIAAAVNMSVAPSALSPVPTRVVTAAAADVEQAEEIAARGANEAIPPSSQLVQPNVTAPMPPVAQPPFAPATAARHSAADRPVESRATRMAWRWTELDESENAATTDAVRLLHLCEHAPDEAERTVLLRTLVHALTFATEVDRANREGRAINIELMGTLGTDGVHAGCERAMAVRREVQNALGVVLRRAVRVPMRCGDNASIGALRLLVAIASRLPPATLWRRGVASRVLRSLASEATLAATVIQHVYRRHLTHLRVVRENRRRWAAERATRSSGTGQDRALAASTSVRPQWRGSKSKQHMVMRLTTRNGNSTAGGQSAAQPRHALPPTPALPLARPLARDMVLQALPKSPEKSKNYGSTSRNKSVGVGSTQVPDWGGKPRQSASMAMRQYLVRQLRGAQALRRWHRLIRRSAVQPLLPAGATRRAVACGLLKLLVLCTDAAAGRCGRATCERLVWTGAVPTIAAMMTHDDGALAEAATLLCLNVARYPLLQRVIVQGGCLTAALGTLYAVDILDADALSSSASENDTPTKIPPASSTMLLAHHPAVQRLSCALLLLLARRPRTQPLLLRAGIAEDLVSFITHDAHAINRRRSLRTLELLARAELLIEAALVDEASDALGDNSGTVPQLPRKYAWDRRRRRHRVLMKIAEAQNALYAEDADDDDAVDDGSGLGWEGEDVEYDFPVENGSGSDDNDFAEDGGAKHDFADIAKEEQLIALSDGGAVAPGSQWGGSVLSVRIGETQRRVIDIIHTPAFVGELIQFVVADEDRHLQRDATLLLTKLAREPPSLSVVLNQLRMPHRGTSDWMKRIVQTMRARPRHGGEQEEMAMKAQMAKRKVNAGNDVEATAAAIKDARLAVRTQAAAEAEEVALLVVGFFRTALAVVPSAGAELEADHALHELLLELCRADATVESDLDGKSSSAGTADFFISPSECARSVPFQCALAVFMALVRAEAETRLETHAAAQASSAPLRFPEIGRQWHVDFGPSLSRGTINAQFFANMMALCGSRTEGSNALEDYPIWSAADTARTLQRQGALPVILLALVSASEDLDTEGRAVPAGARERAAWTSVQILDALSTAAAASNNHEQAHDVQNWHEVLRALSSAMVLEHTVYIFSAIVAQLRGANPARKRVSTESETDADAQNAASIALNGVDGQAQPQVLLPQFHAALQGACHMLAELVRHKTSGAAASAVAMLLRNNGLELLAEALRGFELGVEVHGNNDFTPARDGGLEGGQIVRPASRPATATALRTSSAAGALELVRALLSFDDPATDAAADADSDNEDTLSVDRGDGLMTMFWARRWALLLGLAPVGALIESVTELLAAAALQRERANEIIADGALAAIARLVYDEHVPASTLPSAFWRLLRACVRNCSKQQLLDFCRWGLLRFTRNYFVEAYRLLPVDASTTGAVSGAGVGTNAAPTMPPPPPRGWLAVLGEIAALFSRVVNRFGRLCHSDVIVRPVVDGLICLVRVYMARVDAVPHATLRRVVRCLAHFVQDDQLAMPLILASNGVAPLVALVQRLRSDAAAVGDADLQSAQADAIAVLMAVQKFANAHTAQVAPHAGTSDLKRKRSKRRKAKRDKQRNVNEADSAPSSSLAVLLAQVIKE